MREDATILTVGDPDGGFSAGNRLRDYVDGDGFRRHQHWLAISILNDAAVLTPMWLAKPVDCVGKLRAMK